MPQPQYFQFFTDATAPAFSAEVVAETEITGILTTGQATAFTATVEATSIFEATLTSDAVVTIPCPGRVRISTTKPTIHTDAAEFGVHWSKPARAVRRRIVEIQIGLMDPIETNQLIDAWAGGRGAVREFPFTIPGESSPSRVVFAESRFTRSHRNSLNASSTVKLLVLGQLE